MSVKKRKQVLEAFSKPLSDESESETEPDSDDDDEEVQKRNARANLKGKGRAKAVLENPVVMLISLKVRRSWTGNRNLLMVDPVRKRRHQPHRGEQRLSDGPVSNAHQVLAYADLDDSQLVAGRSFKETSSARFDHNH